MREIPMAVCPKPGCGSQQFEAVMANVGGVWAGSGHPMVSVQCVSCKTLITMLDPTPILGQLYNIRDWIKEYGQKVGVPFKPNY
jgi:hypothetical protein